MYTLRQATAEVDFNEVRNVITSFLSRCDISWPVVQPDYDFDSACRAEATRRGYPMQGLNSLAPFIPGGVAMATNSYGHLKDESTKMFISLYTAFLIYIDDAFQYDIVVVREFNERFVLRKPQGNAVLDCFSELLLEIPEHFNRVVSNIIITSTLNLVTALLLEHETRGMPLLADAHGYPTFSRLISGASEAYALFVFPPELSLATFIQALPELMIYINNGNDILSFYKEELEGDSVNRVSLLAMLHGTSKESALWKLVDDASNSNRRILQILKSHEPSIEAYRRFAQGYIGFHAALPRYRLDELELQTLSPGIPEFR